MSSDWAEDQKDAPAVRERSAHGLGREVRLGVLDAAVELGLVFVVGRRRDGVELLPEPVYPLAPFGVIGERREGFLLGGGHEESDRGSGPAGVARILGNRPFVRQRERDVLQARGGRRRGIPALGRGPLRVEEDAVALRVRAGVDRGLGLELEVARELLARAGLVLAPPRHGGRVEMVGGEDLRENGLPSGRGGELEEVVERRGRVVPALVAVGLLRVEQREKERIVRRKRRASAEEGREEERVETTEGHLGTSAGPA